jgi:hypothetical protein
VTIRRALRNLEQPREMEMRLQFLGSNSEQGTCPAVYETDRGTIVVQGTLVTDPAALGDAVNLASDETLVEIPRDLVPYFPKA